MNCGNLSFWEKSKLPPSTITPAIAVPWPPRNLVAECTTMSAPWASRLIRVRRGDRVVNDQRDAVGVRDLGHRGDVEHVVLGVADRLAVERLWCWAHRGGPGVEVVGVLDEGHPMPSLGSV